MLIPDNMSYTDIANVTARYTHSNALNHVQKTTEVTETGWDGTPYAIIKTTCECGKVWEG